MAILIKGVEMPRNCYECPFGLLEYTSQCYAKTIRNKFACCITHKTKTSTKRNRFCPLEELPTAEKMGKWTHGKDMPPMKHRNGKPKKFWPSLKYCSCCGHEAFDDSDWGEQLFDFCPYCGARMEE